jgi:hypothetical protein
MLGLDFSGLRKTVDKITSIINPDLVSDLVLVTTSGINPNQILNGEYLTSSKIYGDKMVCVDSSSKILDRGTKLDLD